MPRNGRSARAGAVRFAGLLLRQGQWSTVQPGGCGLWRGHGKTLARQIIELGEARQTTTNRRRSTRSENRQPICAIGRGGSPRNSASAVKHFVRNRYSIGRLRGLVPQRKSLVERGDLVTCRARARRPRRCRRHVPRSRLLESQTRSGSRVRKASATWRGEAPCASAIALQHRARLALRSRKIIVTERRIGHHRSAVLPAPRNHRVLDRALLQMIEHLVAGDLALARRPPASRRDRRHRNC